MRSICFSFLVLMLTACSTTNQSNRDPNGSFLTGKDERGINLLEIGNFGNSNTNGLPINALLWRASLDIVSTLPIDDVDTYGGTIITEWYSLANSPNERIKMTFFVLDLELRSDAIRVQVHVQRQKNGVWVDSGTDRALGRKLEELVLTRARELRAAGVTETDN